MICCLWEGSCLIYIICICLCIVVSNTYCVFALFFFVLCTLCCQFLWIVHFWLSLWYSLMFILYIFVYLVFLVKIKNWNYQFMNKIKKYRSSAMKKCILHSLTLSLNTSWFEKQKWITMKRKLNQRWATKSLWGTKRWNCLTFTSTCKCRK